MSPARPGPRPLEGVRAIVTNAEMRLGLYVIRSLGRAGCTVTALSAEEGRHVIGFSSRYAAESHRLPPGFYPDVLAATLESLADRHDVVIPVSTLSILSVARIRERLDGELESFVPPEESVRLAMDKRATAELAREVGVPTPETYDDLDPAAVDRWAEELEDRLPLVVKFADDRREGGWDPADRYSIVRSVEELREEYQAMVELGSPPLVQEYVEGDGYGFFTVMDPSGDPVAQFCHRRLREYPISGGPSTLCESVHDERLVELGTRLLQAMDWQGVAMVEFKQDRRTGEYKLMEINPRFWGSLPLALHCGVDFPVYQAQIALGGTPEPANGYRASRKMRFFFPDLAAVREECRSGGRGKTAARYLKELLDLRIKDGLFDIDDPRPMGAYLWQKLRG